MENCGPPNVCDGRDMMEIGYRQGKLTIEKITKSGHGSSYFCRCDCGNIKVVSASSFPRFRSCGCDSHPKVPRGIDLTGMKFGNWNALAYVGKGKYQCVCVCGVKRNVIGNSLTTGISKSCGCVFSEKRSENAKRLFTKHGMYKSRMYFIWQGVKNRCLNPNEPGYVDYGKRGIGVCDRWKNSFELFFQDMGKPPTEKHSINRIDNDGDYEPGNCNWATPIEQANNTRSNRFITYKNVTKTLAQWARIFDVNYVGLHGRLQRLNSFEEALAKTLEFENR